MEDPESNPDAEPRAPVISVRTALQCKVRSESCAGFALRPPSVACHALECAEDAASRRCARGGTTDAFGRAMKELISVLLQDESIQAIIKSAKSQEEAVKALHAAAIKKDITVTEADLTKALVAAQAQPRTAKLTDQELLGVTGGMRPADTTTRTWCLCDTKRINDTNC